MKRTFFLCASTTFLFLSASARAHDTWLMPDHFEVAPGATVALDLTSGMEFPKLETGPKRARVQSAQYRLAGETVKIDDITEGKEALRFVAEPAAAGIATFWVVLPAKEIELKPDEVKHYLDEIDAPPALRTEWEEMKLPRWRELYTKHQKTFVRVGTPPADDRAWSGPVGLALEIIPETDPTAVRVGDQLAVRVLKNGKPSSGFALNAVAGGEAKGETTRTDSEGRARFAITKAGPWLVRGTDVRKSSRPEADWESDFSTLTFEALPKE